jgi:putative transcriptional regulator
MPDRIDQTLEGKVLVAHPGLSDPNFFRTVLYIVSHSESEGTLGLVLNRPLKDTALDELVKTESAPNMDRIPVFWGGPVATNKLSIARIGWQPVTGRFVFENNLTIEHASGLARQPDASVRAFVGYAGWSAGQLEAEIKQSAWVVLPANPDYLSPPGDSSLWTSIVKGLGPFFDLQAGEPEDPSLN